MTRDKARKKAQRLAAASYGESFSRTDPRSQLTDGYEARIPCPDGCRSQYQVWQAGAGSMVVCAWCHQPVCVDCQREPVDAEFARCRECEFGARDTDEAARRQRSCIGRCITEAQVWERQHTGRSWDGGDAATGVCLNCPNAVCVDCHAAPARNLFGACPACESRHVGYWLPWEAQSWPDLTEQLQEIVAQIGRAGGGPNDRIMGWINRQMGVQRRADADEEHLWYGIEAARRWLVRLQQANSSSEE